MADMSFLAHTVNRRTLLSRGATLMGGLLAGLNFRPGRAYGQAKPAAESATGSQVATIPQFADFVDATKFNDLPESVVRETKRLMLDSIGCALAGVTSDKGKWGIEYVRAFFAGSSQATAIGFGDSVSVPGAAFINAELINGLDWDLTSFTNPGHVSPFVIPPVLAVAEQKKMSGKEFLTACALAHELCERIGGNLGGGPPRDSADGKPPAAIISGCSSVVFGGTAAVAKLEHFSKDKVAQAMSMAGILAPMQSHQSAMQDMPPNTAKYLMAGWAAQAQITAAYLIKAGHRGDVSILDKPWGFPFYAGIGRWNAARALAGLGQEWRFDKTTRYKAYPACGIMRGAFDCLAAIIEKNDLRHQEIDSIHAYIEPSCTQPIFNNRNIQCQVDAQFSVPYNMAVLAFGVKQTDWQSWETMNNPEIRQFMNRVTFGPHPGYNDAAKKDPRAHLEKVEVSARGKTFVEERPYFKGSPSLDPSTAMTDDDLMAKFTGSASRILPVNKMNEAARQLVELENVNDISALMQLLRV